MEKKPKTLKEALKEKITKEEAKFLIKSYDIIGDIAIIEIRPELVKKEKLIAKCLLDMHRHIKVVCKKQGARKGKYRLHSVKIIAGEKRKTTEHRESNARLRLNVETCYFSPRLSSERMRIAGQVKKGENILVMFSGVAPYPVVIAKNAQAKAVYAIELNPKCHLFAKENAKLNKLENIHLLRGDVRKVVAKLKTKFDRVLMPLPKGAEEYLDTALSAAKKGAVIHFYDFQNTQNIKLSKQKIKELCAHAGRKCRIIRVKKCGQHSPRVYRLCIDFKVLS